MLIKFLERLYETLTQFASFAKKADFIEALVATLFPPLLEAVSAMQVTDAEDEVSACACVCVHAWSFLCIVSACLTCTCMTVTGVPLHTHNTYIRNAHIQTHDTQLVLVSQSSDSASVSSQAAATKGKPALLQQDNNIIVCSIFKLLQIIAVDGFR